MYRFQAIRGKGVTLQFRDFDDQPWETLGDPVNNRAALQLWISEIPGLALEVTLETWRKLAATAWPEEDKCES